MSWLLVLPLLIPLSSAVAALFVWGNSVVQRWIGVAGAAALLASAVTLFVVVWSRGIQATQVGDWPAPYGITLIADLFSAIMVVLAGIMGLIVAIYSLGTVDEGRQRFEYYPLMLVLLAGVCGTFLTGDIFNLFVWFEVMLMASFVLLALGGEPAQLEGAIKYVTLNLLASAVLLIAVGLTYGIGGTLNMADLAVKLTGVAQPAVVTTIGMLFLFGFGLKAAIFPLFFWLPASYHTPPIAVTALFSGLLTKVGVYALVRLFTLIFVQDVGYTHSLILIAAGATMVVGVLGAVSQFEVRRLLSFHIVSQVGYPLMGLGLFTTLALTGTIYFLMHVVLAKAALFLVSGIMHRLRDTYELRQMGGLYRAQPGLSLLFLVPALALAGIPPLPGFFAKLALVQSGLRTEQYLISTIAIIVSVLTLYSMAKIWVEAYWPPAHQERADGSARNEQPAPTNLLALPSLTWPTAVMAILIISLGLAAGPMLELSSQAAKQLFDRDAYLEATFGVR